ncbi:hypothetical protein AB7851_08665 [Streptococcus pyogenes]|uniref:hypothetical protein n=1 Tax=Streptococcus TaxID=1301 RepID=UPI0004BE257D|nr:MULTISPECIES: hypothetical protein [Streptococcus]QBX28818.1 hypothetical protein Javan470_0036 [Streptococcus phage Javan470]OBZ06300.1 hypothetical protein BBG02_03375 [Streptococcus dysgalactiae subsp. equisimilis]QCK31855.1 hypothetical protein ETT69_03300 [Streptococcus pyogenes]QJD63359.1 hypothetical protein HHM65_02885 [Streptococcus dysgalactiae subsp. equisimilis]QJR39761.1 hypothetical protein HHM66_07915 [Streptococcus dysgalactiae subsp. equisimilis]
MEVVIIAFLTQKEFEDLGFDEVEDFEKMEKRASHAVNLYCRNRYDYKPFEKELIFIQKAVKRAVAYQIAYLSDSGVMTAEDKQSFAGISLGRTSISYTVGHGQGSQQKTLADRFNLCLDAENELLAVGLGYTGISYDR